MFLSLLLSFGIGFFVGRYPQETEELLRPAKEVVTRWVLWVWSNPHRVPYEFLLAFVTGALCVAIAVSAPNSMWVFIPGLCLLKPVLALLICASDGHVSFRYGAWLALTMVILLTLSAGESPQSEEWFGRQLRVAFEAGSEGVWALLTSPSGFWHITIIAIAIVLQAGIVRWVRINKFRTAI
jgi:hypothetical protein